MQSLLPDTVPCRTVTPPRGQLLKWIGNKQRFAREIAGYFPEKIGVYYEPFLGSGAVLATVAPKRGVGSDAFEPLIQIWQALRSSPEKLVEWYRERWEAMAAGSKTEVYERIKASYNSNPNGADLLFLCRSCYGGVVRFRKADGCISTPCGIHDPIAPGSFSERVEAWQRRVKGTDFLVLDFEHALEMAERGDLVYCDPPYSHSQAILYGAQSFSLDRLFDSIDRCRRRGVHVALSIDGTKRSGKLNCEIAVPRGLFRREVFVHCGRSMLRRFQMQGQTLEEEVVADRLMLTY